MNMLRERIWVLFDGSGSDKTSPWCEIYDDELLKWHEVEDPGGRVAERAIGPRTELFAPGSGVIAEAPAGHARMECRPTRPS
jgi:hypothetical protein